jgi:hypothetical protein
LGVAKKRFLHGDIPENVPVTNYFIYSCLSSKEPDPFLWLPCASNDLKVITAYKGALLVDFCPSDDGGVGCDDGGGVT